MKIEMLYINEAKRIRREYLNNLMYIVLKDDDIKENLNKINLIKEEVENDNEGKTEEFFKGKLLEITTHITKLKEYMDVYYDKIKKLDVDQRVLYNRIKERYTNITDDEMKDILMKEIEVVNQDFISKNKEIYDRIVSV